MKALIIILFAFLAGNLAAQGGNYTPPRLIKTAVSNSGCYAYLPEGSEEFELSYSEDSSRVYTGDFEVEGFHYALIVVRLKEVVATTDEEKEDLLISYLDYLQTAFSITGAAGYGMGHELESNPDAIGVIDYWEDAEGDQWVIKGWADQETIAVMFIYGPTEYPNYNVQNMYLEGFRFN